MVLISDLKFSKLFSVFPLPLQVHLWSYDKPERDCLQKSELSVWVCVCARKFSLYFQKIVSNYADNLSG